MLLCAQHTQGGRVDGHYSVLKNGESLKSISSRLNKHGLASTLYNWGVNVTSLYPYKVMTTNRNKTGKTWHGSYPRSLKFKEVKLLYETTDLTVGQIAKQLSIPASQISRWKSVGWINNVNKVDGRCLRKNRKN